MKQGAQAKGAGAAGAGGVGPTAFEQLEGVLRALLAEHQQLLVLAGEHREAIAGADARALGACMGKQQQVVQRVAALERQRQGVVAAIVRGAGVPVQGGPPAMSALAARAPEPVRGRLTSVGAALRELLNRLHLEHRAIRAAAETLSAHMEGLVRQACQQMSHAGTYERYGGVGNGVQVVSAVDVRS